MSHGVKSSQISVLTPYSAQRAKITRALQTSLNSCNSEVLSVFASQGKYDGFNERKYINPRPYPLHGLALVPRLCGTVYTDAASFVTALVSMRLRLSFTRCRSSSLSEPCRFEYAFKSGLFSKRYGFIGRVS